MHDNYVCRNEKQTSQFRTLVTYNEFFTIDKKSIKTHSVWDTCFKVLRYFFLQVKRRDLDFLIFHLLYQSFSNKAFLFLKTKVVT